MIQRNSILSDERSNLDAVEHNIQEWHEVEVPKANVKNSDQGDGQQECQAMPHAQAHSLHGGAWTGDSIHKDI